MIFSFTLSLLVLIIIETTIYIMAVGFFLGSGLIMTEWENKASALIWRDSILISVSTTSCYHNQSLHKSSYKNKGKVGIGKKSLVSAWKIQPGFILMIHRNAQLPRRALSNNTSWWSVRTFCSARLSPLISSGTISFEFLSLGKCSVYFLSLMIIQGKGGRRQ